MYRFWLSSSSFSCRDLRAATVFFLCLFRDGPNPSELRRERVNAALQALINVSSSGIVSAASLSANAIEATMSQSTCAWDKYSPALGAKSLKESMPCLRKVLTLADSSWNSLLPSEVYQLLGNNQLWDELYPRKERTRAQVVSAHG